MSTAKQSSHQTVARGVAKKAAMPFFGRMKWLKHQEILTQTLDIFWVCLFGTDQLGMGGSWDLGTRPPWPNPTRTAYTGKKLEIQWGFTMFYYIYIHYIYLYQAVTSALQWKPLRPKVPNGHLQYQSCISDLVSWILTWPLCLADLMISPCHCVSLACHWGFEVGWNEVT